MSFDRDTDSDTDSNSSIGPNPNYARYVHHNASSSSNDDASRTDESDTDDQFTSANDDDDYDGHNGSNNGDAARRNIPQKQQKPHQPSKLSKYIDMDITPENQEEDKEDDGTNPIEEAHQQQQRLDLMRICVECECRFVEIECEDCRDRFCKICFRAQHRKGRRTTHRYVYVADRDGKKSKSDSAVNSARSVKEEEEEAEEDCHLGHEENGEEEEEAKFNVVNHSPTIAAANFEERARYIPLRLTLDERKKLRLLEAALHVSNYTDIIDNPSLKGRAQRINAQILSVCGILSGIALSTDYEIGGEMVANREFKNSADFYQQVFELGRRHKIMNPEKMRSEYGKLMYLLQDSVMPEIQDLLEFNCMIPIKTVHSFLSERGAEAMLRHESMEIATRAIVPYHEDGEPKTRQEIRREVENKEAAVKFLTRKFRSRAIGEDDIQRCLYSIGDNNSFLASDRDPIDKMIRYLTTNFKPDRVEPGRSLAINSGENGARLTHNHTKQYHYVLQSLSLWREIINDMFRLWYLADEDLLSENNRYKLVNTGQGINRVQQAPKISQVMQGVLYVTQKKVGQWVGSSVVHLGDTNVPNALMFIDKYTQVSRILNPIVIVIQQIPELIKNPKIEFMIDEQFGGPENLKMEILTDFFRNGFDGSGADNFYDAGSCIDGRLTSAWNWCSNVPQKSFYPVFKLAGFTGFDGSFQK